MTYWYLSLSDPSRIEEIVRQIGRICSVSVSSEVFTDYSAGAARRIFIVIRYEYGHIHTKCEVCDLVSPSDSIVQWRLTIAAYAVSRVGAECLSYVPKIQAAVNVGKCLLSLWINSM
jgi:hypothetical protein